MPVYKRAARPTAASASDDLREPQPSDNDFTVLFKRVPAHVQTLLARASGAPGASPARPAARRQLERSPPAPAPPFVARRASSNAPVDHERETPLGITVAADDSIETVTVPPAAHVRVLLVSALLALGCVLGVGTEAALSRAPPHAPAPPAAPAVPLAQAEVPSPARTEARTTLAVVSLASPAAEDEHAAAAPTAHHHHARHGSSQAPPSIGSDASAVDAGPEGEDVNAAAVQALTKAKEEVTLP